MSWPLIKYVLTAARRDRLIIAMLILMLLATALSVFMGSAAVIEKDRFVLVFTGGSLRLTGILGLVLFVIFMIRRSFENKDVEFLLSRPLTRIQFLLSYSAAFSLLAALMGAAQGLCVYMLGHHLFGPGHWLWIASIIIENIIMVNVAMFFAMVLSSAAGAAMVTFAFYILGRMMGQILGIIDEGSRLYKLEILEYIMQGISAVMPRIDLMGQTSWLVYGADTQIGFGYIVVQGMVFTALVLLAALIDLVSRKF